MLWFAVSASLAVDVLIAFVFFRIGKRKGRQEILLSKPYNVFIEHTIKSRAKDIVAEHRVGRGCYATD